MKLMSMASASQSALLATRGSTNVKLWSTADWSEKQDFTSLSCGTVDDYASLEISPDNSFFVTNGASGVGAYSMANGTELYFFEVNRATAPAISKNGAYVAFCDTDAKLKILDTSTWTLTLDSSTSLTGLSGASRTLFAWSDDYLAIATDEGDVVLYNIGTWDAYSSILATTRAIFKMSFNPDGDLLSVSMENNPTYDIVTVSTVGTTLTLGDEFSDDILSIDSYGGLFTPNGATFIACCDSTSSGAVQSWNVSDWSEKQTAAGMSERPISLSVSADGRLIAVGGSVSNYLVILNESDLSEVSNVSQLSNECWATAWSN